MLSLADSTLNPSILNCRPTSRVDKSLGVAVRNVWHFKTFIVVVLVQQDLTEGMVATHDGKSFRIFPLDHDQYESPIHKRLLSYTIHTANPRAPSRQLSEDCEYIKNNTHHHRPRGNAEKISDKNSEESMVYFGDLNSGAGI